MNRVLFITLHFPPSREIGAHACEQIARYFPLYGWDPVVLTRPKHLIESVDPNYSRSFPGTIVEAGVTPHPISIYRKLKPLTRPSATLSPLTRGEGSQSPGTLRRWILSLLYMPDIYTGWLLPATIAGLKAIRRQRITRIFSSGPYWTNHLVGLVLKSLTGLPWTIHFRDPWTQQPQTKPVSALSARVERWLERLVMKRADSVICVTDTHTRLLRQIYAALPADKFVTIPNGFDEEEWAGIDATSRGEKFVITHPGTFQMGTRSPRPLFRALRQLIDDGDVDANDVRVDLFGGCDMAEGMRTEEMAAQYGLADCVSIGPARSRPETLRRMAASNLLFLLAEGWKLQIPGKTYEYLRAGQPILALTSDGALSDLLRKTGGAHVVEPSNDAGIAAAIREVYAAWKTRQPLPAADRSLVASFDRRLLARRYAAVLDQGKSAPSYRLSVASASVDSTPPH